MKKLTILTAGLLAAAQLTACAFPSKLTGLTPPQTGTGQKDTVAAEETAESEEVMESSEGEEPDLETALFWSIGSTVQMEITTGLTTEYLSPLINYPALVRKDGNEQILEDENDLEELGLRELYTDELLAAVGDFDTEQLEIREDGTAIVGDPKLAYVVLGRDEYDYIGIEEFYCGG